MSIEKEINMMLDIEEHHSKAVSETDFENIIDHIDPDDQHELYDFYGVARGRETW